MLVHIINFFSLNFTSIEIEGERVSSSQNEPALAGGEFSKRSNAEQGGLGSKLGNLERTYFLNVPNWSNFVYSNLP